MILSELLGMRVRTPSGEVLGTVLDVRFRRGARRGVHEGELVLVALLVSPHSRKSFYGYERGQVNRPAILNSVLTWMHRGSRVIPWECVARIDEGLVTLGVEPPDIPLDIRQPVTEHSS